MGSMARCDKYRALIMVTFIYESHNHAQSINRLCNTYTSISKNERGAFMQILIIGIIVIAIIIAGVYIGVIRII